MAAIWIAACSGGGGEDQSAGAPTYVPVAPSDMARCLAPEQPPSPYGYRLESVSPDLALELPTAARPDPHEADRWWVSEQSGRLVTFREGDSVAETVMDVSDRLVQHRNFEVGFLGFAFHPDYPATPWLYLSYTAPPEAPETEATSYVTAVRLDPEHRVVEPETERTVLTIPLPGVMHHGGTLEFGPDGFLYISLGDGSRGDNAQDPRTLLGSLLRIDVDGGLPYGFAPNPFADGVEGRPEVFAWGFRNLWKFTFDRWTGEIWGGDVGSETREEVDHIIAGGNYGWPLREGSLCVPLDVESCPDERLIDPVAEFDHTEGDAVISGYVYRGSGLPRLWGKLLFADFRATRIWALDVDAPGAPPELLLEEGEELTTFAEDPAGEPHILLRYGTGNLRRLVRQIAPVDADLPSSLRDTGCVDPTDPTTPAPHLLAYDVNVPFWSGGVAKDRWVSLPPGARIEVADDGDFDLPIGSVTMKNFRHEGRLIETRLFMRHPTGGWSGFSYAWNEEQTDARLLRDRADRDVGESTWQYPGRADCLLCHTAAAGRTLGLEAAQLADSSGSDGGQLESWRRRELFADPRASGLTLPWRLRPRPETSLRFAARTYLHVNCSGCHRPGGPGLGGLDLRHETPLTEMGACNESPQVESLGVEEAALVAPGDPSRSILLLRMLDEGTLRMPPLGAGRIDREGAELIEGWIASLEDCSGAELE